jgi:hypothetical protein
MRRPKCRVECLVLVAFLGTVSASLVGCAGPKIDPQADEVLVAMCDKLGAAEQMTIKGHRTMDPALAPGLDVVAESEVTAMVGGADRLAAHVVGDDDERKLYYDGSTFTIYDVLANVYATVDAPETTDELMEMLDEDYGWSPPLSSYIANDPYEALTEQVKTVTYVGREYVSHLMCDHLAFKEKWIDWDLWVSVDDGLPVRLVITATAMEGEPQLVADVLEIDLQADHPDEVFKFVPPEGAEQVEMLRLAE